MKNVLVVAAYVAVLSISGLGNGVASTEKVLYSFPGNSYPYGRLETDSKGALYGTAYDLDGAGAIYKLKQKNGVWRYSTLFDFGGTGGANPFSGLTEDHTSGIFYGTSVFGGSSNDGTVYTLAPVGRGWNETVLHSFNGSDGYQPYPLLLKDKSTGNLYGTTFAGGPGGCGTAFQLVQSGGSWTFSTLYSFQGGNDACNPFTQLKPGAKAGTLIGAAQGGNGKLFQLKQSNGVWSESVIYTFTGGSDGAIPYDLDTSSDGTIYGVTVNGGQYGQGVVFQLTPNRKKWSYSVLYSFQGGMDGSEGVGINLDASTGTLYGTTYVGGTANDGTVFQLVKNGSTWTETNLHSFSGGLDGANPQSRPIIDRTTGILYGTTVFGGQNNGGTVYQVQP